MLKELQQRQFLSKILKNFKDFFDEKTNQIRDHVFDVNIVNSDTTLLKETAENTRGVKGRLDEIIKKTIDLSKIEKSLENLETKESSVTLSDVKIDDVKVTNTVKTSVTNWPEPINEVRISNLEEIKLPKSQKVDLTSLETALNDLKTAFSAVVEYLPNLKPQEFPKITIPRSVSLKESPEIIEAYTNGIQGLRDDIGELYGLLKQNGGLNGLPENLEVKVTNFPPQHIPTPVTNFNLNSLKGVPLSSAVTVTTTPTSLPATPLEQRRSLIIFNNSGETIYLGGEDVTTSTGLPVLDQSYSPPIDAGAHMILYAVSSASGDVRVFEVSNDSEGN